MGNAPLFDDLYADTNLLAELNEEQLAAVTTTEGPLIIIAGAGTGKTKVITAKIAYLIEKELAKPEEILALTFTDKAAQEMKSRIDQALPYGQNAVDVGTFHSFGDSLIKENAFAIGLTTDYKLFSSAEEIFFFKEHLFAFPLSVYRPISNPARFIEAILRYFSRIKDEAITPLQYEHFLQNLEAKLKKGNLDTFDSRESLEEYIAMQKELFGCFSIYEQLKKENGFVNFADLITLTLEILQTKPSIREYYQHKYKYILVDEYQDTNFAQNEIVKILAEKHKNLCICGDDDQSIYKFRGASISNILTFEQQYPTCKKIVLTKNYRSSQEILDGAYTLITQNNPDRLEIVAGIKKQLSAASQHRKQPIIIKECETLNDEMQYIAQTIQTIKEQNPPMHYADFAILIRSHAQSQAVIRECNINNIPFIYQGNAGLYETPEIRFLLSFLYSLARFDDNINLFHIASSHIYGISMQTLSACNNLARVHAKPLSYIFRHIETYQDTADITEKQITHIAELIQDIDLYLEQAREQNIGQVLLSYIQAKDYLTTLKGNSIENVQKFFQKIDKFIATTSYTTIQQFCDYIDYTREMGDDPSAEGTDLSYDGVQILTIHRAKGMEFDTVFMIDLVDGRFPTREMKDQIEVPLDLISEVLPHGNFHLQEERRLFYVGMTRAKERLYLVWAKDYYQKTLKQGSQFLYETGLLGQREKTKRMKAPTQEKDTGAATTNSIASTEQITLSASQIETYLTCPKKYAYTYQLKIAQPHTMHLFFGTTIHAIINQVFKSGIQKQDFFEEDARALLDALWQDSGFLSDKHMEETYQEAKKIITNIFLLKQTLVPAYIEKPFHVQLDPISAIAGRWDFIDDMHTIIDFKTTKVKNTKEAIAKAKESIQLKIYAWSYEKIFQMLPSKVSLCFVGSNTIEGYTPTAKTLQEAEKLMQQVLTQIRVGDFAPNPSFLACTYCAFNKICEFTATV